MNKFLGVLRTDEKGQSYHYILQNYTLCNKLKKYMRKKYIRKYQAGEVPSEASPGSIFWQEIYPDPIKGHLPIQGGA